MADIQKLLALAFNPSAYDGEATNAFLKLRKIPNILESLNGNVTEKIVYRDKIIYEKEKTYYLDCRARLSTANFKRLVNHLNNCFISEPIYQMKIIDSPFWFIGKWVVEFRIMHSNVDVIRLCRDSIERHTKY